MIYRPPSIGLDYQYRQIERKSGRRFVLDGLFINQRPNRQKGYLEVNLQKDTVLKLGDTGILRVLKESDVTEKYVQWLNDYEVVKFTEQRFSKHDLGTVQAFVRQKFVSDNDYLFGIFWNGCHIGNIKLGPIDWHHLTADVSYFLGSKDHWGNGIATLAVGAVVEFADSVLFEKVECRLLQCKCWFSQSIGKCGSSIR